MIKLLRNPSVLRFGALLGGRVTGSLAMFLSSLVIARVYGAEGLSEFAVFVSALGLLSAALTLGFNRIGTFLTAEYLAKDLSALVRGFLATGLRVILIGSLAACALCGAILLLYWNSLSDVRVAQLLAVPVGAAGVAAIYLLSSVMVGFRQQPKGLLPDALLRPALFLAAVLSLALAASQYGIVPVISIYGLCIWVALGVAVYLARPFLATVKTGKAHFEMRRWIRAALPWSAISLSWDYLIEVMILVAGLLTGRAEIAVLYVCFRFRVLAGFGLKSILMLVLPDLAALKAQDKPETLRRRLMQANILSAGYVFSVMIAFAILGNWLLSLFDITVAGGHAAMMIVALAMLFGAVFGPAPQIMAIHDLHRGSATIMVVGLVMAIAMMAALVPAFGIIGAAFAYAAANGAVYFILWRYALRKTGIDCSLFALIGMGASPLSLFGIGRKSVHPAE